MRIRNATPNHEEIAMKRWKLATLTALGLFAGCALTGTPSVDKTVEYAGTVKLVRLVAQRAEIVLDDTRYVGEWRERRCFTPECRGAFWNIASVQRKHVRRGSAELASPAAVPLKCEWVRYREDVVGSCVAGDGRIFRLAGN